jgi:hypothetical protein
MDDVLVPFIGFTALGLFLLATRLLSERPGRARDTLRSLYLNGGLLVPMRMVVVTAPFAAFGSLAMGLGMLLPRYYAAWVVSIGVSVIIAAMALSYRPPTRIVPKWFREEIANGTIPPMRTDLIDWTYFLLLLTFAVVGPIAFVVLIVVYGAAGSPP